MKPICAETVREYPFDFFKHLPLHDQCRNAFFIGHFGTGVMRQRRVPCDTLYHLRQAIPQRRVERAHRSAHRHFRRGNVECGAAVDRADRQNQRVCRMMLPCDHILQRTNDRGRREDRIDGLIRMRRMSALSDHTNGDGVACRKGVAALCAGSYAMCSLP